MIASRLSQMYVYFVGQTAVHLAIVYIGVES